MIRQRTESDQKTGFAPNPGIVHPDHALRLSNSATVLERLEQLSQIGIALSKETDIQQAAGNDPAVAKLSRTPTAEPFIVSLKTARLNSKLCRPTPWAWRWAERPASKSHSIPCVSTTDGGSPYSIQCRGLRVSPRYVFEYRGCLHGKRLRFLWHQEHRQEDGLPVEIIPDGTDEES